jgi:hypothetical protein
MAYSAWRMAKTRVKKTKAKRARRLVAKEPDLSNHRSEVQFRAPLVSTVEAPLENVRG